MEKALDKLKAERDSLVGYVEAHKALISPARRLPLDIIQEIFVACIPTHRNCVMSASEAPVLLGRICSSWRAISLSTPRIWARLHIVEPERPYNSTSSPLFNEKWAQRLQTTKTWLGRSGQCPLSISLEINNFDDESAPPSTETHSGRFLQTLLAFATRWQHIQFVGPPALFPEILGHLTEMDVPILRSLVLYQRGGYPPSNPISWDSFGILRGRSISSFSISGNHFIVPDLPLRWDQLTELSFLGPPGAAKSSISSAVALQTISKCPALRSYKLRLVDDPNAQIQANHPIVEHLSLQTLELYCVGDAAPISKALLGRLALPQLRNFALRGHTTGPEGMTNVHDVLPLSSFLVSSTRLEYFQLDTHGLSKPALLEIIPSLAPTVKQLQLFAVTHGWEDPAASCFDDEILSVLTPTTGLSPCCPVLQDLYLYCSMVSDAAVLRFITARMAAPTLKRVVIQFHREMEHDILPDLQPFIESGLDVSITHYAPPSSFILSPWQGLLDDPHGLGESKPWIMDHW
ncbi:hypothetical protein DFH09DRAFT_1206939 [Mycena vulgaris]|nr:hypothetical protein DFH09DRAFT_1206939 [Mycena vulgaris]